MFTYRISQSWEWLSSFETGADCSRSFTFGEGLINSQSISFRTVLAIPVSNLFAWNLATPPHLFKIYLIFTALSHWEVFFHISCKQFPSIQQDCTCWNRYHATCMPWHESSDIVKISLHALLPCFGHAGLGIFSSFFIFIIILYFIFLF